MSKVREIHGCAGVRKVAAADGDFQNVTVTDGENGCVRLSLSANSFPADLTTAEAAHIAHSLNEAVARLTGKYPK